MSVFYVPSVNLIGCGVINEIGDHIKELGYKKALLVTDHYIASSDFLPKVTAPVSAETLYHLIRKALSMSFLVMLSQIQLLKMLKMV